MEQKRRRRFGFGLCCSLFGLIAIVVLGSVLPVVLIPISTTSNETTLVTTTSIVPTTTEGTTTYIVPTTTVVPTTSPIFTPSFFQFSNIVEYSFPKNKFIRMNYTQNEIPISLVVYQESEFGMVDWETKIPCFNISTPISGFNGNKVTIDTSDQSILVNALCLNFTANMTFSHTFKFDTNGNLLWRTQLPTRQNTFSERNIISGNNIFFIQTFPTFFTTYALLKLDKISGTILNLQNDTYFSSFCNNIPAAEFYIRAFSLMENNTLFVYMQRDLALPASDSFCSVFIDQNYNFVRRIQADYPSSTTRYINFYLNTTNGGHTLYLADIQMIKYDGNGNLVANFDLPNPPGRLYLQALSNLRYELVFYNGFHYMMVGWRSTPGSTVPYNQTIQLGKYDFINNIAQLGPDILIASFPNSTTYFRDFYFLTSPQLFNNSLLLAGYQGTSVTRYQFKQYYQFPITF